MTEHSDTLAAELVALRDRRGLINPADAVAWARQNTASRLHAALQWDDAVAGEHYRVWQVRNLIAVHIVDARGDRKFVSLSIDRTTGGGYRPMSDVMARVDLREIMINDALAALETVQKRYDKLTELSGVWVEADKLRERRREKPAAA